MKEIVSPYYKLLKEELQKKGFTENVRIYQYENDLHQIEYWAKDYIKEDLQTLNRINIRYYMNIIRNDLLEQKQQNNGKKRNHSKIPTVLVRKKKKRRI